MMINWMKRKLNAVIDERVCMYRPADLGLAPLKVMRTDMAKRFPLIHTKKDGDVGYDLPATLTESMIVPPNGGRAKIPTGISIEIPKGWWASIEARSSTSELKLLVPKGVIDEGYRGELLAVLVNVGDQPVEIKDGDRLVQLIMHRRHSQEVAVIEVDELSPSERGATGFGSSGKSEQVVTATDEHTDTVTLTGTYAENEEIDREKLCKYCDEHIEKNLDPTCPACEGAWCEQAEDLMRDDEAIAKDDSTYNDPDYNTDSDKA